MKLVTSGPGRVGMNRSRSWLGVGFGLVLLIAAAKPLLHLATASRYAYFGDCSRASSAAGASPWGWRRWRD
jgi:hypothetical protein